MGLRHLIGRGFRNLHDVDVRFNDSCNLFFGDNGSGKTNLLEAVHLVCHGRSFRTHQLNQCIESDSSAFLLRAEFDRYRVGIKHLKNGTEIHINGQSIRKISDLVKMTPTLVINETSFDLLCGSPEKRRQYIDWCLFHVEHSYRGIWNDYRRIVKQKNHLLRARGNQRELQVWNQQLIKASLQIQAYRQDYLGLINKIINTLKKPEIIDGEVLFQLRPGWTKEGPEISVENAMARELKLGYCLVGAHRDKIILTRDNQEVCGMLSRGQLKRLSILCQLAAITLVHEVSDEGLVILIDDLEAELDKSSVSFILQTLKRVGAQTFITNIGKKDYLTDFFEEYKMFHVEHGMIQAIEKG